MVPVVQYPLRDLFSCLAGASRPEPRGDARFRVTAKGRWALELRGMGIRGFGSAKVEIWAGVWVTENSEDGRREINKERTVE